MYDTDLWLIWILWNNINTMAERELILWGGCFWGVQQLFDDFDGFSEVIETEVGYAGWEYEDADYDNIWDHSEVVKIRYDDEQVGAVELIKLLFEKRDPTFPTYKTQYDTLILYNSEEEKEEIEEFLEHEAQQHGRQMNVRLEPRGKYYKAEPRHQKYFEKQERSGTII